MRSLLLVALFVGCSGRKDEAQPAAGGPSVSGDLEVTGALAGRYAWAPGLTIEACACEPGKSYQAAATLRDAGGTTISIRVSERELVVTGPKPEGVELRAARGVPVRCDLRDGKGRMALQMDSQVQGERGAATLRGKLEFECR